MDSEAVYFVRVSHAWMSFKRSGFHFQLFDEDSTMYKGHNSSSVAKLKVYYRTCMNVTKIEADGTGPILKVDD